MLQSTNYSKHTYDRFRANAHQDIRRLPLWYRGKGNCWFNHPECLLYILFIAQRSLLSAAASAVSNVHTQHTAGVPSCIIETLWLCKDLTAIDRLYTGCYTDTCDGPLVCSLMQQVPGGVGHTTWGPLPSLSFIVRLLSAVTLWFCWGTSMHSSCWPAGGDSKTANYWPLGDFMVTMYTSYKGTEVWPLMVLRNTPGK